MNNIHAEFIKADHILNQYVEKNDKFQPRFVALCRDIQQFIREMGYEGQCELNELALGYLLVDYFEDIHRLKAFHHVSHINSMKIVAYTSYWFLRRKPIQVLAKNDKELLYVNERFILAYIMDFLSMDQRTSLLMREEKGLDAFKETLFYFLKYRFNSANSLDIMLTAFFAGQIYQEEAQDLSALVARKYDED